MKEKILNYIGQDGLLHILCCSELRQRRKKHFAVLVATR